MKKIIFAFLTICCFSAFAAEETSKEVVMVDSLIECAQNNLNTLTALKDKILQYEAEQNRYMQDPQNTEALYKMIKLAHLILENIKSSQLTPLFEPSFLSELTIVSKPAAKLGIPKP